MAGLWTGSNINNTESATLFNKVANRKALAIVQRQNPLLYRLMGKADPTSAGKGFTKFQRTKDIAFKRYEVRLLGTLLQPSTVSDGAGETATATKQFDANQFGGAEFDLTHYAGTYSFPSSQLLRYKGDNAKTASFIDEQLDAIMKGYELKLGTDLHSTSGGTAIGRTVFGSWCFAVSTGGGDSGGDATGETGNAFRNYGTLDRQDAANADFRGIVDAAPGSISLATLRAKKNLARVNQGTIDTVIAGTALYTKIENLVEAYTTIDYKGGKEVEFGGESFEYAGMDVMMDAKTPSGTIGMLDSETWEFIKYMTDLTSSGIIVDPGAVAAHCIITELWAQLVCKQPNRNVKLLNAS